MPNGIYKLGETAVHVEDGRCTAEAGVLAGSVIALDQGVARFQEFTGAELDIAVRLASSNPARMLGLPEALASGSLANFNVYDASGRRTHKVLRGRVV